MTTNPQPCAYIIAGPNGAGKSTFCMQYLPDFVKCREFVNADMIAAGLSPFNPESQAVLAGRLQLIRIKELMRAKTSFGFETTLSGRTYLKMIRDLKTQGYRVFLFFLWLPDADLAVNRVANRVRQGGHNIPEDVVRRRYASGLKKFFDDYRDRVDEWHFYDASHYPPIPIAISIDDMIRVYDRERFRTIQVSSSE